MNQQQVLQNMLSEIGINLTDEQVTAVQEAVQLTKSDNVSYLKFLEFKEKYKPKRVNTITYKQIEDALRKFNHSVERDSYNNLANHYNENNQPER